MLHILWILLKFILILLGILLGLILVAVLLILFCPVRYRASGTKETDSFRDISARARVSWLFGVVSFQLQYQNGTSAFDFRLFGIPIMKLIQKFRNRSHPAEKKPQNGHADSLPANTEKSTNSTDFKDVSTADSCRSTNEASDLTEETVASERDTDLEYARTKIGHLFYRLGIFFRNLWNRLSRLWQKICRIPSSDTKDGEAAHGMPLPLTVLEQTGTMERGGSSYACGFGVVGDCAVDIRNFWNIPEQKLRFLS